MDKIIKWEITRYSSPFRERWDAFVERSRNAAFMLKRGYMDYHADRFDDCSLIALRNGKPAALLPANLTAEGVLASHGGLTYGGWLLPPGGVDGSEMLRLFDVWTEWCRREGILTIDYKPLPAIYHRQPSQEDIYALFRNGAEMTACGLSATIDYSLPGAFNTMQRRHLRKALSCSPHISEVSDVSAFHSMLSACLRERHSVIPVHTCAELQMLRDLFPEHIRVFELRVESELMAGVVMYLTDRVAHAQYIATTPRGRQLNMLTPLFAYLIDLYSSTHRYFDFGISTEEGGAILNDGLLRQKFSLGGSGTIYPRYVITL